MNKERLGGFIAENRKALDMTQKDLAERLHITDKAVSKWERGLSYPDVTLLEPLVAALGLGVEELMACRRQEEGEEPVKALLDISRDSVKQERRRGWSRLIGVLVLLAVTGLVVLYAVSFRSVREDGGNILKLKETVEGVNYLYMEEPGRKDHLLKLRCGDGVDFDAIQLTNEWGEENSFRMSFRWNRWTRRGVVTECEPDGVHLGGLMDVTFEADCAPLFGYPEVFFTTENYYPDPYSEPRGKGFLCDARFWVTEAPVNKDMLDEVQDGGSPYPDEIKETILLVEDCRNAAICDWDGDGQNEVVVRTRWQEKPYTVYDMADGELVSLWPDTVPQEVRDKLVCIWEQ